MRNLRLYVCMIALLAIGVAQAASIDITSTGMHSSVPDGTLDPLQAVDPNWSVIYLNDVYPGPSAAYPPAGATGTDIYVVNTHGFPFNTWINTYGDARWVAPKSDYTHKEYDTPGYYLFRTTFYIPEEADLSTVILWGAASSDNCTHDIRVNGVGTGFRMAAGTCPTQQHAFEIVASGGETGALHGTFQAGVNTLDFVVQNLPGMSENPVGLAVRVHGSMDVHNPVPEPASVAGVILGLGALAIARRKRLGAR